MASYSFIAMFLCQNSIIKYVAIKVNHEMTSFIFNCSVCARNQYSIVYFSKALRIIFDDAHTPNPHDLRPLIQLTRNSHISVYISFFHVSGNRVRLGLGVLNVVLVTPEFQI